MSLKMCSQRGFNLIESLVSLLVLSIGLLGVASMITNSVRFSDTATMQSQAISLAYDLVDKIRANSQQAVDYAIAEGAVIANPPDCNAAACTAPQMALADLADWKAKLAASLPGGDGSTRILADRVTVTVVWADRGDRHTFDLELAL